MSIRVIVADDQALVRAGFRKLLESEPGIKVVGEAANGLEAVESTRRLHPDVVLMDIRMPTLDGIEATRRIVAAPKTPRVVMLTTFDMDEYVFDALRAGASGFLLKASPPESLIEAVHIAAGGDAVLGPSITRRLIEEFARRPTPGSRPPGELTRLTPREIDVLRLLGRGLSNVEIAAELFVGVATVKTHVGNALTKLGIRDRAQAIVFAYESGLVQSERGDTRN